MQSINQMPLNQALNLALGIANCDLYDHSQREHLQTPFEKVSAFIGTIRKCRIAAIASVGANLSLTALWRH